MLMIMVGTSILNVGGNCLIVNDLNCEDCVSNI